MMRIGIFHNRYLQRGGEDTSVDAEAELLAKAGHRVARLTVDNREEIAGVPFGALRVGMRARWNSRTTERLAEFLSEHPIDVAHVHNFFPILSPALHAALRARGIPVVQTLHNYRLLCANGYLLRDGRVCEDCVARGPWNAVRYGCYRGSRIQTAVWADMIAHHRARRTFAECVDRFAVPSAFALQKLLAAGLPAERCAVVPYAVADPGEPSAPGSGAVYVGRLSPEKGVAWLLDAWRELPDVPLTIVGGGPEESALRERARDLPNVRLLGEVPHDAVLAALRAAAFAVVPSLWYEISPFALLEALACGRPVVAPRPGALAELVDPGRTGLLYEQGDARGLVEACRSLARDAERLPDMGAEARRDYLDRYAPDVARARLEAIYTEVTCERRLHGRLPDADRSPS